MVLLLMERDDVEMVGEVDKRKRDGNGESLGWMAKGKVDRTELTLRTARAAEWSADCTQ